MLPEPFPVTGASHINGGAKNPVHQLLMGHVGEAAAVPEQLISGETRTGQGIGHSHVMGEA
ncbi:hypothetical protein D3C87_2089370 [compost metagenome]